MTDQLYSMIRQARHCTAFTGAGVSTLSGIRDFRGKNGVYLQPWHGMEVEEILSLDCFRRDPGIFYAWAREFVYRLAEFHPSAVHRGLAELEKQGLLGEVITQNIDLLHQQAGSQKVCEIHGSPASHHCRQCRAMYPYAEIAPLVMAGEIPRCRNCGGVIKPDIVFYGENLDESNLNHAFAAMAASDLVLVLGSSLTVQPAASLPLAAYRAGSKIVIVNDQDTPLDDIAALRFRDLRSTFEDLEQKLQSEP